jgi:anti-sigma-K factor RskA
MVDPCETIHDLLAAYALDALSLAERWQVDEHLESCPSCRDRLDSFLRVGEALLCIVPAVEPPVPVRARLIASLADKKTNARPRMRAGFPFWRSIGVGALVALLALNATLFLQTRSLDRRQQELAAQLTADQTSLGLAAYPSAKTTLISGDGTYGTFLYEPDLPISVLYVWGLGELDSSHTYQAWLIKSDGVRVNAGIFHVEPGIDFVRYVVHAPQDLSAYTGIGVTIEPSGGSSAPTGPRVLGADL